MLQQKLPGKNPYIQVSMYVGMKRLFLYFFLVFAFQSVQAQSLAHDRETRLGKGANLTNWLEAYWLFPNNWPEAGKYQKSDLQNMKDAGMSTVRLPFCFALITDSLPPYAVDFNSPGIAWLDSVIQWCDDLQMNLIIDNQHGWDITNDNYTDKIPPMTAMWRQVVNRYINLDPEQYFFEMLNEPPAGVLPEIADSVNLACIAAVRQSDQLHTLIVGPHTASIGSSFLSFQPYADTNLIYTFHTYEPLYFTHQGFSWFPVPFPTGTPFPLLGDDGLVRTSLEAPMDWRTTHNRPVFMGEFGVGINADASSRCTWVELMGDLIDQYNLNWCYWDWGGVAPSDFSMFSNLPPSSTSILPCFEEALHLYGSVGRAEAEKIEDLKVGPIPANDQIWVSTSESSLKSVELYDLNGRLLFSFPSISVNRLSLNVSSFPAGMYMLKAVARSGKSESRKIILE